MKRSILPDSLECKLHGNLLEFFNTSEDGSYRMVKVIVNPKNKGLELSQFKLTCEGSPDDWTFDFNNYISNACEASSPCFIFYRLDEKNKATGRNS